MDIDRYGDEFAASLGEEWVAAAEISASAFADQTLYAFCVHLGSGFHWVGACMNTREHLHAHTERMWTMCLESGVETTREEANELHCELLSDEWQTAFALPDDHFARSNELLQSYDQEHYDSAERWERGNSVLCDAVERAILHARERVPALLDPEKILTGLQVVDPCDASLENMVRISSRTNAPHWHAKFLRYKELFP